MTYQPPQYDPQRHQQRMQAPPSPQWQQQPAPQPTPRQAAPQQPPQPRPRKKRHIAFWTFMAAQFAVIIWMITANVSFLFMIATLIVINGVAIKTWMSSGGDASNARLRGYGVVVDGDTVKRAGYVLGKLATAHAELTQGTSRHTLTRTVTVVGAATKKVRASVIVTTIEGGYHEEKIESAGELRRAQAWVAKFNAMSATAAAALEQPAQRPQAS